jgi:hypothetical protein
VPQRVTSAIRDMLGNELLETQREALGDILQGEEYAKDGLVIWKMGDPSVNEFSVFIGGISGETARVVNPVTREEIILRKTLERRYLVRGDAMSRGLRAGGAPNRAVGPSLSHMADQGQYPPILLDICRCARYSPGLDRFH